MAFKSDETAEEVSFDWFMLTLRKYIPCVLELTFIAFCARLIGLVEPFVFQVIIDRILPFQRQESLIVLISIFAVVCIFQMGFQVLSAISSVLFNNMTTQEFVPRIFDHVFKLPFTFYRKYNLGALVARIGEVDVIRGFITTTPMSLFLDFIFVIVYLFVLFSLSNQLAWIVLFSLPIQIGLYFIFGPIIRQYTREKFDIDAQHNSIMVENLHSIISTKALCAEHIAVKKLEESLSDQLAIVWKMAKLNMVTSQLNYAVNQALGVTIIYMGATLAFEGELTLGQLIAFHLMAGRVAGPIRNFAVMYEKWQMLRISRQRLGEIINTSPDNSESHPLFPSNVEARLSFDGVTFGYLPKVEIFSNFNFEAQANTLTIVVGASGVGKSTFGKLAAKLESPTSGLIKLGGYDIAKHDTFDVRNKISYIPQEPFLFSGTLRENLLVGDEAATDEDIHEALNMAAAGDLTNHLPLGLDSDVGERGMSLSGGQRQRVAIARSLLRKPKILIMDEPTSSLDATAQALMAKVLNKLKSTTTIIIITHRSDVFENPDQIVDFGGLK